MERRFRSPILAVLLVLTLAAALLPVLSRSAQAEEVPAGVVAISAEKMWYTKDGTITHSYKYYYSINDAWEAAGKGTAIKLMADWDLKAGHENQDLRIEYNESVTVHLNGWTISRGHRDHTGDFEENHSSGDIFYLSPGSRLTVYGADSSGKRGTLKDGFEENDPILGTSGLGSAVSMWTKRG